MEVEVWARSRCIYSRQQPVDHQMEQIENVDQGVHVEEHGLLA